MGKLLVFEVFFLFAVVCLLLGGNDNTLTRAKRAKRDVLLKPTEIVQTVKKAKMVLLEDFSQLLIKSVS